MAGVLPEPVSAFRMMSVEMDMLDGHPSLVIVSSFGEVQEVRMEGMAST